MSSLSKKILLIDDESSIIKFIKHSLSAHGFEVIEAPTGALGLQKTIEARPELIILDYGLPDMTGLEVLKKIREWSKIPVLFLTVRDAEEEKVLALDAGADDYLTKPFSMPELLARMRVALRHVHSHESEPIFKSGVFEIDRSGHSVKVNDQELKLTPTEYALIKILVTHAGKVVPQRAILNEVWGPHSIEHGHYLRIYFGQIRKKFENACPGSGELIQTESGVGYRLKLK